MVGQKNEVDALMLDVIDAVRVMHRDTCIEVDALSLMLLMHNLRLCSEIDALVAVRVEHAEQLRVRRVSQSIIEHL